MGLNQYMYRIPNSIEKAVNSSNNYPKSIHSACRNRINSSYSFHSLCNAISSTNTHFTHRKLPSYDCDHIKFHFSANTKFYVDSASIEDAPIPDTTRISEEAEKICKILSKNAPDSDIASSLDELGVRVSASLVEEVLKKLSNAGMFALGFFRWAERKEGFKHTTRIFHHLIEALGKIKQFRLIWSLVESMKQKGLLSKETFVLITRRYARARKIKEAVEAFEKMEAFGFEPELADFNSLIDTISKSKHVEKAQAIFNDLKRRNKFDPNLKTYSILLEGWGNERNLPKLKEVYYQMLDEGFTPDVITYGILISSFCKSRRCDDALKIYHEMESSRCKPSPHIYCALINGLGSDKRLDEALKLFELTKANGFAPEAPTYNALVGAYCWALQFEDASKVVEEMKQYEIGPNARTYDIIIHHLIKAGKKEEAYWVFRKMVENGGCEPQMNSYTMMVGMLCKEEIDLALKVWNEMGEKGILPCMHMFSSLINALCFENRLDEACGYFREMLDRGIRPPGTLFSNLKEALISAGNKELAFELGSELDALRKRPLNG